MGRLNGFLINLVDDLLSAHQAIVYGLVGSLSLDLLHWINNLVNLSIILADLDNSRVNTCDAGLLLEAI